MIGAKDLVGCTVITVLSRRGIWMGHFWEREGFTEGDEQFEREVIDAITWGDGPEMPSLSDAARQYFGPDPQDNYASSDKIYILTVLSNGVEQAMGQIAFPAKIERIVRVVSQVLTGGNDRSKDPPVTIFPYTPEKNPSVSPDGFVSPRGKVIFQYSPVYSCYTLAWRYAEARLYYEDTEMIYHAFVPPLERFNTGEVPEYWPWYFKSEDFNSKRALATSPPRACPIISASGPDTIITASTGIMYTTSMPDSVGLLQGSTASLLSAIPTVGTRAVDVSNPSSTLPQQLSSIASGINPGLSMASSSSGTALESPQSLSRIADSANSEIYLTSSSFSTASAAPQPSATSVFGPSGMNTVPTRSDLSPSLSAPLTQPDQLIVTSVLPPSSPNSTPSSGPSISINPAPTTEPAPPYISGICNIHIQEAFASSESTVWARLSITDGAGQPLGSKVTNTRFGKSVTVESSDTKLPYPVSVTFTQKLKPESASEARMKPRVAGGGAVGPTLVYQKFILELSAGATSWNSAVRNGIPKCTVGDWNNGDFADWLNGVFADPYVPVRMDFLLTSWSFRACDNANDVIESPNGL
ncbi:hypothetical protein ACEPPN_005368 [Leptodophora sp. 'Broadleaf-Isolate-01']